MNFKRSIWWGIGGAVALSVAAWFIVGGSRALTDAFNQFFLVIGLNPREQGLWCALVFVAITSLAGFIVGRGIQAKTI